MSLKILPNTIAGFDHSRIQAARREMRSPAVKEFIEAMRDTQLRALGDAPDLTDASAIRTQGAYQALCDLITYIEFT